MEIETILNAMQFAQTQSINLRMLERLDPYSANMVLLGRRERQWLAFNNRIIRMVEERDGMIIHLDKIIARKIADIELLIAEIDEIKLLLREWERLADDNRR